MNKRIKLSVIFLAIFITLSSQSLATDSILPLPKPSVDEETKIITAKKKEIYPQKKPIKKIEKIETSTKILDETEEITIIYPQKKPILFQKKIDKAVVKSTILSSGDLKIAKAAFEAVKKKKWQAAIKRSKKAKNKMVFKMVNWFYLIQPSNSATFYDYLTFINNNPNYPRINRLKYLAEHKMYLKTVSPKVIKKWFNGKEPLSEYGKIKLGEIYLKEGNIVEGSRLLKEGWIKAKLSKKDLKYLRKKYKKIITVSDNIKRADWHAWEGKHWDVQRMLSSPWNIS